MNQLLYILRHGESTVNLEPRLVCGRYEGDLTETGREQAHKAGVWLKDKQIAVIYASPFHRVQQTAATVSEYLNLPVITDAGLGEMHCGSLASQADGVTVFWKIYQHWLAGELDVSYPDGESLREGMERYAKVLQNACSVRGNALLVTHGGISRAVVPLLCGVKNAHSFGNIDKTGMIILEPQNDDSYRCQAWNLLQHLETAD